MIYPKNEKNSANKKTVAGYNKGHLTWGEKKFALITLLQEDIAETRWKQVEKKEEKSAEELFCSSFAAKLKELPEYERCMANNELQNVIFQYQMMVLKRQCQVLNYTEKQDSYQYLMPGIPLQHSHTQFLPTSNSNLDAAISG